MPRKVFVAGEILTAADVNTNLMDQAVMVFDDATDRATAIPTPVEGMVTYLKDTDEVDKFDGADFVPVGIAPAILQVVQTVKTDVFSTATNSFVDVTGLNATITPTSTSNKILISSLATLGISAVNGHAGFLRLSGGNSQNFVGDASQNRVRAIGSTGIRVGGDLGLQLAPIAVTTVFLDSPATVSPVTYSIQLRHGDSGNVFLNRAGVDLNNAQNGRYVSSIVLMEVAG